MFISKCICRNLPVIRETIVAIITHNSCPMKKNSVYDILYSQAKGTLTKSTIFKYTNNAFIYYIYQFKKKAV